MTKGRLLHHGTLLFSSDLGVLDRITTHRKNDCFQSKGTQSAICTVTNIREHLARPMTIEEFRERLLDRMVPPGSPRLTLTPEQEAEVCRLRDEKYRSWEWTWGKTPAFAYEKTGVFAGAPIRVAYQAKRRHCIRCNGGLSPAGRRPGCRTAGGRTAGPGALFLGLSRGGPGSGR